MSKVGAAATITIIILWESRLPIALRRPPGESVLTPRAAAAAAAARIGVNNSFQKRLAFAGQCQGTVAVAVAMAE